MCRTFCGFALVLFSCAAIGCGDDSTVDTRTPEQVSAHEQALQKNDPAKKP